MVTRINGFSGMDVDSLVKSMMASKRLPLDKMNQNKQTVQWQRDNYREMNSKIYDFRNNKLSLTGYKNSAAFNTQTAVIKDIAGKVVEGNNGAVKAEASASATGIPMQVSVKQLASPAKAEMDKLGTGYTLTMSLEELQYHPAKPPVVPEGTTPPPTVPFKLTLNGQQTIEFSPKTTLGDAISEINANSSLNVKASFDDVTGQLVLSSRTLGAPIEPASAESAKREIVFGSGASNSFLKLFLNPRPTSNIGVEERLETTKKEGKNAVYTINGQEFKDSNTNSATFNGVALTFQAVTGTWAKDANNADVFTNDQPLTITTQVDAQKALDTVKKFINDYNTFINDMDAKVSEERYKDFPPLTDEQRSAMSESDIKAWEEKAKSGMLKNDPFIKTMISSMRGVITDNLGALSAMGITTGQYFENGKLYIDEAKFKKAVDANPEQISNLFLGKAGQTDKAILNRISEPMTSAMDKISERAGTSKFSGSLTATFNSESVMGRQLKDYNNRISRMATQLTATENRYYKQYAAMEAAMTKYQSQLSQLTGASS